MASNNLTKDQVLALFPDNHNFEITAADMRQYVEAIFADSEVVVNKIDTLANLGFNNATIYEGSLVVIYNDIPDNIGIYLSKVNQPTLTTHLIQLSTISGGGSGPSADERGGILYETITQYYIGDMVSHDTGSGLAGYICINNTSGAFNLSDWQAIGSGGSGVVPVNGTLDRAFGKISAGTDVSGLTPTEMIEQGYIGEIISSISISSPSNLTLEKGNTQNNITIDSTTTLGTGTLTTLEFLVNGSVVDTDNSPSAGSNSFVVATVTDTTSFNARITDTIGVDTSNTRRYTYVYPYYYGSDAQGITDIANLTKDIRTSNNNINQVFTSNNDVFYFCYPQGYGALNSILDENGFETIGDWTLRAVVITGLDGSAQTYSFYEFNNVTTTTTNFTFIR